MAKSSRQKVRVMKVSRLKPVSIAEAFKQFEEQFLASGWQSFRWLNHRMFAHLVNVLDISDEKRVQAEEAIAAADDAIAKIQKLDDPKFEAAAKHLAWAIWQMYVTFEATGNKKFNLARLHVALGRKLTNGGRKGGKRQAEKAERWHRVGRRIAENIRESEPPNRKRLSQEKLAARILERWDESVFAVEEMPRPPGHAALVKMIRKWEGEGLAKQSQKELYRKPTMNSPP